MLNLLPEQEKKIIDIQRILRKMIILSLLVVAFFLFFTFFLWCFKFYLSSKVNYEEKMLLSQKKSLESTPEVKTFREIVKNTNQKLQIFHNFYQTQPKVAEIINEISTTCPQTIYFTNFSLDKISVAKNNVSAQVSILGYAKTREDLFFFKKALEKKKDIDKVDVLPQSWENPENVNFSLNLKVRLKI